jgi:excisionase family DNA binding protein
MGDSKARRQGVAGEVLTIEELAVYLKIAKSTLYKLSQEGRIPSQKVGRHWRFSKAAIDRWLEDPGSSREAAGGVS